LRVEREKRAIAERRLEAVEKERQNPFIVPAVFKAFVEISRLTNDMTKTDDVRH
jgi:hypothetical protein